MDACEDLITKLYSYIDVIIILSTSYMPINLIPASILNGMIIQAVLQASPDHF